MARLAIMIGLNLLFLHLFTLVNSSSTSNNFNLVTRPSKTVTDHNSTSKNCTTPCDPKCRTCINGTCLTVNNSCYISKTCYEAGELRSKDTKSCLQCLPNKNQTQWSFNPACSVKNQCRNPKFLARHICNLTIIKRFYINHDDAIRALYDVDTCARDREFCEPGFFLVNDSTPRACCPGFFCPDGQACMIPCRPGSYCQSPLLPNDGMCLTAARCPKPPTAEYGRLGCGGSMFEGFCPLFTYCPNPTVSIKCNGSSVYCPTGVIEPLLCRDGFRCFEGRSHRKYILTVSVSVIFSLLFLLVLVAEISQSQMWQAMINRIYRRRRKRNYNATSPYFIPIEANRKNGQNDSSPFQLNIHLDRAKPRYVTRFDYKNNPGFTGCVTAGRLTALMGGSGCGKSSLMESIQGLRSVRKGGSIRFAQHHPMTTALSDYIAFVPQADIMHSNLTVFETVFYSARARRLEDNINTIINDVHFILEKLDLGTMHDKLVDKLSGGQKKRVNIAMEIAACPKVLLLDEPTSGLDTVACDKLFDLLNLIKHSEAGPVTIVMVVHQPSQELFQQIDDVLFLTAHCCLAYQGVCSVAKEGLDDVILAHVPVENHPKPKHNVCDSCFTILTHAPPLVKNHDVQKPVTHQTLTTFDWKLRTFLPFIYIMRRTLRQMFIRSPVAEALYCAAYVLFGECVGYLFQNDREKCDIDQLTTVYFMISLAFGITTCVSSQRLFGVEIANHTFKRESRNYYHPFQYWLAKSTVDVLCMIIYPLLFLSLLFIALDPRGSFLFYLKVMILLAFACSGIGQCTSVLFERTEYAYLAGTLVALLSCFLSGFSPTKTDLGRLDFIVAVSFSRHAQHLLFQHETNVYLQNVKIHRWSTQVEVMRTYYSFSNEEHPYRALIAIGLILRAITLLVLYAKSEYRSKQRFFVSHSLPDFCKRIKGLECDRCLKRSSNTDTMAPTTAEKLLGN